MKQFAFCILALGISSAAFGAGACTDASLATYIAQGSCTVGNFTFNNFSYLAVNVLSMNVSPDNIMVDATAGPNGPNVTFTSDATLSAVGVLSVAEYLLGFEVTAVTGIDFQSVNLTDTGSVTGLLPAAAVAEVDCNGGLLQLPNTVDHLLGVACLGGGISVGANAALPLGTDVSANANIVLSGTSDSVDVLKDVTLSAVLGSASVTGIGQSFTTAGSPTGPGGGATTPEPASFFLGGCGLIGFALIGRHKAKAAAKTNHSCLL